MALIELYLYQIRLIKNSSLEIAVHKDGSAQRRRVELRVPERLVLDYATLELGIAKIHVVGAGRAKRVAEKEFRHIAVCFRKNGDRIGHGRLVEVIEQVHDRMNKIPLPGRQDVADEQTDFHR